MKHTAISRLERRAHMHGRLARAGLTLSAAALLIGATHIWGVFAAGALAATMFACAQAVRANVENSALTLQLRAIDALGKTCASGVRDEMPLTRFLELASELVRYDRAVIWLLDEESAQMRARAAWPERMDLPRTTDPIVEPMLNRVVDRCEPLVINEPPRLAAHGRNGVGESWLFYPLALHGRCMGVAHLARSAGGKRLGFDSQEVRRVGALAPQAALALQSVRLRHETIRYQNLLCKYQDMARQDGLTGLNNHRRCQDILREEAARAARYGRPLSVVMMDVDSFKQFNDLYGHPVGDMLLRAMSRMIRESVREIDHVGRYGGEEFIVILPETGGDAAAALAERIRARVAAEWFSSGDGRFVQKTLSLGVAAYPQDGATAADLLHAADSALYRAKRAGKNRVLVA